MGNVITNNDGYVQDSVLGDIVNKWALNDYDAGLGYCDSNSDCKKIPVIKELLKKRACCIRQDVMSIALPNIDIDLKNKDNPIKDGYNVVHIRVFNDLTDLKHNCTIENKKYLLPSNFDTSGAEGNCIALYEGDYPEIGLCASIKKDRQMQYDNPYDVAYSIYPENQQENVYSDCNCLNSMLRDKPELFKSSYQLSGDLIAQKFDNKCSNLGNNVYKRTNVNVDLCVNIVNADNLSLADKSIINLKQSCNFNNTQDESVSNKTEMPIIPPEPQTTNTSEPQTTNTSEPPTTPTASSNILKISIPIIIGIIITAIIYILFFVFRS